VLIFSAIKVVISKNIVHSAFYLAVSLLCVAIYFILLRAEYLAAVQILVYIGAIVVLVLFALMLTRTRVGGATNISSRQNIFAAIVSVILFAAIGAVLYTSNIALLETNTTGLKIMSIKDFSTILFSKHMLPFEVASVLLLAALVGSVVLAMKEKQSGGKDNKDRGGK
jgi:NADH-quinone oxidoreductase subunit J